jgi:hypothetical protein
MIQRVYNFVNTIIRFQGQTTDELREIFFTLAQKSSDLRNKFSLLLNSPEIGSKIWFYRNSYRNSYHIGRI